MPTERPALSVIVPVRDGGAAFRECLAALRKQPSEEVETLIVDDASSDGSPDLAREAGFRVVSLPERRGPAAARNLGAALARGEILLFIDADIVLPPEAGDLVVRAFRGNPAVSAMVGTLDPDQAFPDLPSHYFHLRKHFDYRVIRGGLSTLYTAVSAVRSDAFRELGGFCEAYRGAAMEDAELGRRLVRNGHEIALLRDLKVAHLKRHSLRSLLRSDFLRAGHFAKFLVRERLGGRIVREKRFGSFRPGSLASLAAAPLVFPGALAAIAARELGLIPAAGLALFVASNASFIVFCAKRVPGVRALGLPLMIWADSLAVGAGIVRGLCGYLKGDRY